MCPVTEMAAPRRMGAALTYARRYALFTLVGIAGEDDLDAPEVAGHAPEQSKPPGNRAGSGKPNGRSGDEPLGSFAKGRKPWSPPRQLLDPTKSAGLRDRLLEELAAFTDPDQVTAWAHRSLRAKHLLVVPDAARIETAFAARVAALEGNDFAETQLPSSDTHTAGTSIYGMLAGTSWPARADGRSAGKRRTRHSGASYGSSHARRHLSSPHAGKRCRALGISTGPPSHWASRAATVTENT